MAVYDVWYVDPPWFYNQRATWSKQDPSARTRFGGGAHGTYKLMRDEELLALGDYIKPLTAKDALLFLWATGPRMDLAIRVMQSWGFEFATIGFVWAKLYANSHEPCLGPGFYTASNCEYVLIGRKGKPSAVKRGRNLVPMLFEQKVEYARLVRQEHSRKPDEIRDRIRELVGDQARCIELFARQATPGWTAYGDEITGRDIREDLERDAATLAPDELSPDQLTWLSLAKARLLELTHGGLSPETIFEVLDV